MRYQGTHTSAGYVGHFAEYRWDTWRLPLHEAAASGSWPVAACLAEHLQRQDPVAVDENGKELFGCEDIANATRRLSPLVVALTTVDALGRTPLLIAAQQDDADTAAVLLAGAIAAGGFAEVVSAPASEPPLCAAVDSGSAAIVRAFVRLCPRPHLVDMLSQSRSGWGRDPLYLAVRKNDEEMVRALLEPVDEATGFRAALVAWRRREASQRGGCCSPLCIAIRQNQRRIVPLLLRAGFSLFDPVGSTHKPAEGGAAGTTDTAPTHTAFEHCRRPRVETRVLRQEADAAAAAAAELAPRVAAHYARRIRQLEAAAAEADRVFSSHCGEHERGAIAAWRATQAAATTTAAAAAATAGGVAACGEEGAAVKRPRRAAASAPAGSLAAAATAAAALERVSAAWEGLARAAAGRSAAWSAVEAAKAQRDRDLRLLAERRGDLEAKAAEWEAKHGVEPPPPEDGGFNAHDFWLDFMDFGGRRGPVRAATGPSFCAHAAPCGTVRFFLGGTCSRGLMLLPVCCFHKAEPACLVPPAPPLAAISGRPHQRRGERAAGADG